MTFFVYRNKLRLAHWFINISFQGDCQWIEGLPASGGLARRLSCPPSLWRSGGVVGWPADHFTAAPFT